MQNLIDAAKRCRQHKEGTIGWHRAVYVLRSAGLNCDYHVKLLLDVDAALAAKDAENSRIRHVLQQLLIDCNGKIHADHWNLAMSALEMNDAPPSPHPDSARLDKLPQCFHMIRNEFVGTESEQWWLTYQPSKSYSNVREAIDAHQEPRP